MKRLIFMLTLAACGDPLVGPSFSGTPELSFGGAVVQASPRAPSIHGDVRLGLFWIGGGDVGDERIEQQARLDSGLAEYSLTMFDAPPDRAYGLGGRAPGLAIGVMVLYADADGSGSLDLAKDVLLGATADHVLVHAATAIAADAPGGRSFGALAPGYRLFQVQGSSACRFVSARDCAGDGATSPAEDLRRVTLTLWANAEDVLVPAPSLDGTVSVWAQ